MYQCNGQVFCLQVSTTGSVNKIKRKVNHSVRNKGIEVAVLGDVHMDPTHYVRKKMNFIV